MGRTAPASVASPDVSAFGRVWLLPRGFALDSELRRRRAAERRSPHWAEVHARRIRAVSAEPVAPILHCELCGRVWVPAHRDRWRAYPTEDEGELVFFCPACAAREFDD